MDVVGSTTMGMFFFSNNHGDVLFFKQPEMVIFIYFSRFANQKYGYRDVVE